MQRHFKQRWTDIPSYSKWSLEYRYPNTGSGGQAAVEALPKFIQILAPLDHDARERAIGAAMILLGDNPAKSPRKNDATKSVEEGTPTEDVNGISAKASAWVKKHGIVANSFIISFRAIRE